MNKKITIFTDGASKGNPGLSGAGIAIEGFDQSYCLSSFLGLKTNNEAEYLALLLAAKFLHQLKNKKTKIEGLESCEIVFKLDSLLVVKQMSSEWKIKEARLAEIANQIKDLLQKTGFSYQFVHVEREHNQTADWLANQAIDLERFTKKTLV